MVKDIFLIKQEFVPSDQITEPTYVWNLIALFILIRFCFFLFQAI